jgi:hypothetical protein
MDLVKFVGPYFTREDAESLKEFHKNKMYVEDITYDIKLRNLKYFWDYTCQNLARVGIPAQEVFSSLQYEGYMKTCLENLDILKQNPQDQEAFTNYQVAGMFVLRHDFSNFNTHFTVSEISNMKKRVEESFLEFLNDPTINEDRRCIIADCLVLASCSAKTKKLAMDVISRTRLGQVNNGVPRPQGGVGFNRLLAPEAPRPKGVKDISTDSQNVHSSNISSIVKRKLLILEQDQIPSKKEFKTSVGCCKKLKLGGKTETEQPTSVQDDDWTQIMIYFGTKRVKLSNMFRTDSDGVKFITNPEIAQYLKRNNHAYDHPENSADPDYSKKFKAEVSIADGFIAQTLEDVEIVAMKFFKEMFNHTKELPAFSRIATDTVVFAPSKLKLSDVFQRVFNRVMSQVNKDYFQDLMQRVFEELQDSNGVCATGYVSRLLNILQGYPEIDIEVVDSYEEDIFKEINSMFDLKMEEIKKFSDGDQEKILKAERIEDGLISFDPEERKPFEEYFRKNIMEWYLGIYEKFVNSMQVYSAEWFDEDFSKMVFKFSTIKYEPNEFKNYRIMKKQSAETVSQNPIRRLLNTLFN